MMLTKAYADWGEGKGPQPSIAQVDEAQGLERAADNLSHEMDQLVQNLLR